MTLPSTRLLQPAAATAGLRTRILPVRAVGADDERAWRALAARALEPNPFYEPDCLVPAALHQHFGAEIDLVVAEDDGAWRAVMPIRRLRRWRQVPYRFVTTQVRRMTYLGTPLVDADTGQPAVTALLGALVAAGRDGGGRVLVLQDLEEGPVAAMIRTAVAELGREVVEFERGERGVIRRGPEPAHLRAHGPRTRRNLARKLRNLGRDLGVPVTVVDRGGDPQAIEDYVRLEASGYKGGQGIALTTVPGEPEYFRDMCRRFAAAGRLRLLTLTDGTRSVAMVAWVRGGDTVFQFKWSFDEDYSRYSPGLILHTEALRVFDEEETAGTLDTCTWAENDYINHMFPDRCTIVSWFVPLGPGRLDRLVPRAYVAARPLHRRLYALAHRRRAVTNARGRQAPGAEPAR